MTRAELDDIARALVDLRVQLRVQWDSGSKADSVRLDALATVQREIAHVLQTHNPTFDKVAFGRACSIPVSHGRGRKLSGFDDGSPEHRARLTGLADITRALVDLRVQWDSGSKADSVRLDALAAVQREIAHVLQTHNPTFDKVAFGRACSITLSHGRWHKLSGYDDGSPEHGGRLMDKFDKVADTAWNFFCALVLCAAAYVVYQWLSP